jgi:hypothetical protein
MAKILTHNEVNAKHIRFSYTDALLSQTRVMTTYTGTLTVGHGAGHEINDIEILYPVLGLFPDGGFGTPGIVTIPVQQPNGICRSCGQRFALRNLG